MKFGNSENQEPSRLDSSPSSRPGDKVLGSEADAYFSRWQLPAIRELLQFHHGEGDSAVLGKKLDPPIGAQDAARALAVLERLRLVHRSDDGSYRTTNETIRKDSRRPTASWRRLMESQLRLARRALRRWSRERRDISGMTLALSENGFSEARREMQLMRERLIDLAGRDSAPTTVFQLNMQLFPLSADLTEIAKTAAGTDSHHTPKEGDRR